LEIEPDNFDAWLNKGSILHRMEKFHEAIECYDVALTIDSKSALALAYKGLSLGEMTKLEESVVCFDHALEIDNMLELARDNRKIALELLKNTS